jgi:hypothetical protein
VLRFFDAERIRAVAFFPDEAFFLNRPLRAEKADEAMRVMLLRQATTKLTKARECRDWASVVEKGRAAELLDALATELELQAHELVTRAEQGAYSN